MLQTSKLLQHANFPESIKQTAYKLLKVEIQGATNVAIESLKAVLSWLKHTHIDKVQELIDITIFYLDFLANVRPNEPLAKNAVKFLKAHLTVSHFENTHQVKKRIEQLINDYLEIINISKQQIVKHNLQHLENTHIIFTHCHSSTVEKLLISTNKHHKIKVVATETRPLYQGRITATNLLKNKVETIMIVDSACPRFIADDSILPVDVVLLGADEITVYGDAINKVGSYGIALSAYYSGKPVYVVTPLLKLHYQTLVQPPIIEQRDAKEIWKNAPKGLRIINPAFDFIPRTFITGYLTEFGLLKPEELEDKILANYPWIK